MSILFKGRQMNNEIAKIKYHISILAQSVKFISIDGLAVELNLSKQEFGKLFKICDKFERQIDDKKPFNYYEFESVLKDKFGIDYQGIKTLIRNFIEYNHFTHLAYVYQLSVPNPMSWVIEKYKSFEKGKEWEQEFKKFIDEVIQNSKTKL